MTTLISAAAFSQEAFLVDDTDEIRQNVVKLYPNPARNFLTVSIHNTTLKSPQVGVYSIIGSKMNIDIEAREDNAFSLDIRNLPTGYYLLVIKDSEAKFNKTYKFLKRE